MEGTIEILAVVIPPGDQEKVPPAADGVAVNIALVPAQTVWEFTVTDVVDEDVIVTEVVAVQPMRDVAITL